MGISEAVEGVGLAKPVAQLGVPGECALTEGERPLVFTAEGVLPADGVQGVGLPGQITRGLEQRECQMDMAERFTGAALAGEEPADVLVDAGVSGMVAELPVQAEGKGQVGAGLVVAAELDARTGQVAVCRGLRIQVMQALRGDQRGRGGGGPVAPVAAAVEVGRHHQRKLPRAAVQVSLRRKSDGCQQHGLLGVEPGQRIQVAGRRLRYRPRLRCGHDDPVAARVQQEVCCIGGVRVVVQHPPDGCAPLDHVFLRPGPVSGVGA